LTLVHTDDAAIDRVVFTCVQVDGAEGFAAALSELQATEGVREVRL
jgi:hypothetical protein